MHSIKRINQLESFLSFHFTEKRNFDWLNLLGTIYYATICTTILKVSYIIVFIYIFLIFANFARSTTNVLSSFNRILNMLKLNNFKTYTNVPTIKRRPLRRENCGQINMEQRSHNAAWEKRHVAADNVSKSRWGTKPGEDLHEWQGATKWKTIASFHYPR